MWFTLMRKGFYSTLSLTDDFVWTDDSHAFVTYQEIPKYNRGAVEVWGAITYYGTVDLLPTPFNLFEIFLTDFPFLFKVNCLTLAILLLTLTVLGLPGSKVLPSWCHY